LSGLKVLRSLQVKELVTNLYVLDFHSAVVMEAFSTIASPVFSELVIVYPDFAINNLPRQVLFEMLRKMDKIRRFKLVFLVETKDERGARRELAAALDSIAAEGLLDFLDSPPTIRTALPRRNQWAPLDLYQTSFPRTLSQSLSCLS